MTSKDISPSLAATHGTPVKKTEAEALSAPLWMERILTIEGYKQLRSKRWTLSGAFLLMLGLLSDYAQLATTYFDAGTAENPFLTNLPFWALCSVISCILLFIVAIASRSRFCALCSGYLPHMIFAAVVFFGVFFAQRSVLAEETDPETGHTAFIDSAGNQTRTNSVIGYLLGINLKIDTIYGDVSGIKKTTDDTNQRTERIEEKVDQQTERIETFINLSTERNVVEMLALRFGHDNPDAPTSELIDFLKIKSKEYHSFLQEKRSDPLSVERDDQDGVLFTQENLENMLQEKVVLLLQGDNNVGDPVYSYLQITIENLQKLKPKLDSGESFLTADFGTVLAAGRGAPSQELRAEMAKKYGMKDSEAGVAESHRPNSVGNLIDQASSLFDQGEFDESERIFREVLDLRERVLGPKHLDTVVSIYHLGTNLISQDKYKEAVALFRKAFEIQKEVLGPHHPDTRATLNILGKLHEKMAFQLRSEGRHVEAEEHFRDVSDIREKQYGKLHPLTASSRHNLADNLYQQGKFLLAKFESEQALSNIRAIQKDHENEGVFLRIYARIQLEMGEVDGARKSAEEAIALLMKSLGPDHEKTQDAKSILLEIEKEKMR